ncbi:MAG: glycerol-3-phosphate dehydrogenase/oxidase [Granulosicoccus sp.]|nr:glycerol-3-phosphate dehydrogenase/oxidase [Granulosicoccus sp.]
MSHKNRQPSLQSLQTDSFDVVIVGGGISGAWIARLCSASGLKTALVERGDFGSETSSASSKLLHGGIRYLQQLQFGKVRESSLERAHYLYAAPHLASSVPFVVPTYRDLKRSKWLLRGALTAYDLLGMGQGSIAESRDRLKLQIDNFSASELNGICDLAHLDHTGALAFPEWHMYDSERTVWAIIESAQHSGAVVANYLNATRLLIEEGKTTGLIVSDMETGQQFDISSRLVVNAAGPWVDFLNEEITAHKQPHNHQALIQNYAAGAHIITRQLTGEHAIAINTKHKSATRIDRGGRHIFIIPWRGYSLIGTSYRETEDPDSTRYLGTEDLNQLLDAVNETLPSVRLSSKDIISAYIGLYPLRTNKQLKATYQGSGEYTIVDHEIEHGISNLVTALGAKYTTGRILAEKTLKLLLKKIPESSSTANQPLKLKLQCAQYEDLSEFSRESHEKLSDRFTSEQINHLIQTYGSDLDSFVDYIEKQNTGSDVRNPIVDGQPDIQGQIPWAVEREMSIHLDDVLYRRTSVGLLGISETELTHVANQMSRLLDWSEEQRQREIKSVIERQSSFRNLLQSYYDE